MVYNVYGPEQVDDALRRYHQIANNAPQYSDSYDTVHERNQAERAAQTYIDTVNQGYHSKYGNEISALADKYRNNTFRWSAETSPEYRTYQDYYRREGEKSQEHVQGSYAANTGGYSNSYAMAAGQRAYGEKMEELAAKIPALRNTALQNWNRQQEQTMNQISLLKGFDDTAYSRFRDKVNDTYNFMNYYQQKYSTAKGLDMSAFQQELSNWQARLGAAQSDLSNIRQLAESQYEHNSVSADTQASINQSAAQNAAYYAYLRGRV